MGKAVFEQQQIRKGHMVKYLYKLILGWPIMFSDLNDVVDDGEIFFICSLRDFQHWME